MAGMVIQHNISSIKAKNRLGESIRGTKKSSEKLSSGFSITRSADNAAGLAISEKMRAQARGLQQAVNNSNDAISLIQTAEGGLNEIHAVLHRARELAVQSSNGTYLEEDREAMNWELDALKAEINRIAESTEYNNIKLLDGTLKGAFSSGVNSELYNEYGARYGATAIARDESEVTPLTGSTFASSIAGVSIEFTVDASGVGGENAFWDDDGTHLVVNLCEGVGYTEGQLDKIIDNATRQKGDGQAAPPAVKFTHYNELFIATPASMGPTVAGVRSSTGFSPLNHYLVDSNSTEGYANHMNIIFNSYGYMATSTIDLNTDVAKGDEFLELVTPSGDGRYGFIAPTGAYTLHLATGVEYSEEDLEKLFLEGGLDVTVELRYYDNPSVNFYSSSQVGVNGDGVKFYANTVAAYNIFITDYVTFGQGVGKDFVSSNGRGLNFQIGANGTEDQNVALNVSDMSTASLGIEDISIADRDDANDAINVLDWAIYDVSQQRSNLGALQNRLEYAVNNLTAANENMIASESVIRDTDMAQEMVNYTKYNILQQSSQAMLAQANQAPESVLQLLG